MTILGLSCYFHDSSATLVIDGEIIAAAEEERFTRKKHDNRFPEASVAYCLKEAGITIDDIDAVCFFEKPLLKLERVLSIAKAVYPLSHDTLSKQLSLNVNERLFLQDVLKEKCGYTGKVTFVDHHLAHAASAYYTSDFDKAAIMTVDGVGEWASTVQYFAEGTRIKKIREIRYPHSLGMLYSTITGFLGFKVNNDEYKVMGLASYGKPVYLDTLKKLFIQYGDGSFRLNLEYFSFMHNDRQMYSQKLVDLFGAPRVPESTLLQWHIDLAASVQKLTEEAMITLGKTFHAALDGQTDNICLAGGVALNSVANWILREHTPFKNVAIQPAAGDGGSSVGAALYYYYNNEAAPASERVYLRNSSLYGPGFSNDEIQALLDANAADYEYLDDDSLYEETARLIRQDYILGWFQGRMEFGPRALGSRSIIANACNPKMKDILNERVKFREDFRPFAPAVLKERAAAWFELDFESPHMLFVCPVKPDAKEKIPAVTHTDGSARVQTVNVLDNPRFHKLIEAHERLTGVPVVINTSFNIRGEPIVCTPEDAYNCFINTNIDFLIMGNYLIRKLF